MNNFRAGIRYIQNNTCDLLAICKQLEYNKDVIKGGDEYGQNIEHICAC